MSETFATFTFMMLRHLKEPKLNLCNKVFSLHTRFVCMGDYSVAKKTSEERKKKLTYTNLAFCMKLHNHETMLGLSFSLRNGLQKGRS